MNLRSGLTGANSCVKMILHAPSDHLSKMNLDIVTLNMDMRCQGCLRNESSCTLHQLCLEELLPNI